MNIFDLLQNGCAAGIDGVMIPKATHSLGPTTNIDDSLNECIKLINRIIHLYDFGDQEMNITNLLRHIMQKISQISRSFGDTLGYQGTAFGSDSRYINVQSRKGILKDISNMLDNILRERKQQLDLPDKWQKDLMDISRTIEKMFIIRGEM